MIGTGTSQRTTTVKIEFPGDARHLFAGLPIKTADSAADEREILIPVDGDNKKRTASYRHETWDQRAARITFSLSVVVCMLFLIAIVITGAILLNRVNNTISSIDDAVGLAPVASNAIRNIDVLLNNSAAISDTVHRLGLKGLDASVFSQPFLTRILNSTTALVEDVHRVAEHPQIQIGR